MKQTTKIIIALVVVAIAIVAIVFGIRANNAKPGAHDALAQHITDSGAIFYGAYWCPHCAEQKALFGRSVRLLNYVECAIPGRPQGEQTQACKDANISSYPTWDLPDGQRLTGVLDLDTLAELTEYTPASPEANADQAAGIYAEGEVPDAVTNEDIAR